MAKVFRKKMARGVELTVDQVFDPISAMATELSTGNIEASQLEARYATFRMNFNIPWMGSKYFYDNRTIQLEGELLSVGSGYAPPSGSILGQATTANSPSTGSGLTLDIVKEGGEVVSATIRATGDGYAEGDTVNITGGVADAVFTITKIADVYDGPMYIPFCLPPLQENITTPAGGDIRMDPETPTPVLEEISFSLDQSDEPAMMLDHWYGRDKYQYSPAARWMPNPFGGKKTYTRPEAYEFTLSIYEKEQFFFNSSVPDADQFGVGGEAVSIKIPSTAFIPRVRRFNPIAVSDINRQFHPLKTYCMAIYAPKLHDQRSQREHCAAVNVWVSLKFRMELTSKDTASAGDEGAVQNIPKHYGVAPGQGAGLPGAAVTVTAPVAGDLVVADGTAQGVSTNLQHIDQQFSDKLRGGYNEFAQVYPSQDLKDDAAYEVIAVPLGAGFAQNRMSARDDYPLAPYVTGSRFTAVPLAAYNEHAYVDRRIIPIDGDMTIHHVVAAINWTSDKLQAAYDPATLSPAGAISYVPATFPGQGKVGVSAKYSVGVGMLCGPRADSFDYQQVAYSEFTPDDQTIATTLPNGIIDIIKMGLPGCATMPAEWAMLSVPLVHQGAGVANANGKGYWGSDITPVVWEKGKQGTPFFVGEGNSYTRARTAVGMSRAAAPHSQVPFTTGAVSNAQGAEQFLELRLSMKPDLAAYIFDAAAGALEYQTNYNPTDVFLGYGGCWVYIIGKKHLK